MEIFINIVIGFLALYGACGIFLAMVLWIGETMNYIFLIMPVALDNVRIVVDFVVNDNTSGELEDIIIEVGKDNDY